MSVLVKGMSIPRNCRECGFYQVRHDIGYYDYEVCMGDEQIFNDGYDNTKPHIDPFTEKLENCPLVEQTERVHGHWVHRGCGVFECDQCGKLISTNVYKAEKASDSFKFCPECGAGMKGEQDA